MKKTRQGTAHHYIEDAEGNERKVNLVYNLYPEQKQTRDDPYYPPEEELVSMTYDDDGSDVPEGLIDEVTISVLGGEAAQEAADRDEAAKEFAAECRAEHRRERRLGLV